MQVLETIIAPVISEPTPEFEPTLTHWTCRHYPNEGFCGTDVSNDEWVLEDVGSDCAVCEELSETMFHKDICPRTGKPCSNECIDGV